MMSETLAGILLDDAGGWTQGLSMQTRLAAGAILIMIACVTHWEAAPVMAGTAPLRLPTSPGPESQALPMRPDPPAPRAISGACPSEQMSCYPGCANVGDNYACGKALITLAGGLAAALAYLAAAEGLSLEAFCGKYGTLCAKAKPEAEPSRHPDHTPCHLVGSGGVADRLLKCRYKCNGELIQMLVAPPAIKCPGYGPRDNLIKWEKIKWLPIDKIL